MTTHADFLALLFCDANGDPIPGWIETRHLADTKGVPGVDIGWWSVGDLTGALATINTEAQRRGDAVFFGVLPRLERGNGTAAGATDGMVAWCDLDFKDVKEEEARARVAAFQFAPSITIHSGRGLHLYWLMQEPTEPATLREVSKRIAAVLGGDHCFDAARILRMPGSRNLKACWLDNAYAFDEQAPEVVIESAPAHRYQSHDFEGLPEAPEAKEAREVVLPLNAAIPSEVSERVRRLIKQRPKLAALWKGEGKTHGDQSNSGYDLSFAVTLILYGVGNPADLAAAIAARPSTTKKLRTKREVWRTVDRALDVTRPSVQEAEREPPPIDRPFDDNPPDGAPDGTALSVLATFADRVKVANGDAKALKRIELELLHPQFIADLANCDGVDVAVALSEMQIRGFTGVLRKVEKAMSKAAEQAKVEAEQQAAAARKRMDEKRKDRELGEEWPITRVGKHPGIEAALSYRKGQAVVCHANLVLILSMDPRWSGRFRVNLMGDALEIDGALVDAEQDVVSKVCVWISRNYEIHYRLDDVKAAIYAVAMGNAHHPVRDYLRALPAWDGVPRTEHLLANILGVSKAKGATVEEVALYEKFLRRFLISAVARAMTPGCKVDTALIFTGEQGAKKSTFFKYLFGVKWFGDSPIPIGDKNAPIQLRSTWGYEAAELESLSRRTAEEVKQFLSSAEDLFRNVFERNARFWPRHSVICGSTNKPEFLSDPTGSRRFWPIPVPDDVVIDIAGIKAVRDQVWAEALALYRRAQAAIEANELPDEGCRWWFERDEDKERAAQAQRFEVTDPWDALVMGHIVGQSKFTIADILTSAIGMAKERMDQAAKNRVGAILRRHGWRSKRARSEIDKTKFVDVWVHVETGAVKEDRPSPPVFRGAHVPINDDGVPF